jgi:hypothetical protein
LLQGLQWVRRRQRALARAVLALFVLAWLQAAAVPCVMAQPALAHAASGSPHCPYCPPTDSPTPQYDDHGGCAFSHQPQVDTRATTALAVLIPVPPVLFQQAIPSELHLRADRHSPDVLPQIPLSTSYCRYLE